MTLPALLFLVMCCIGVPVAIAIGLGSTLAVYQLGVPMQTVAQRMFASLNSFPLAAIPFFILAGALMQTAGISTRLVNLAQALVGGLRGGLGLVTVIAAMFFAMVSGSGAATTAAIGSILIPAMAERGYPKPFATALQAGSGELGAIIPPSIPMVLLALTAGVPMSIGDLFMAGVIPGFLLGGLLMITIYIVSRINGYGDTVSPGAAGSPRQTRLEALKEALLPLGLPVIILGGIYGGLFTPTESAIAAVLYALALGVAVYRNLSFDAVMTALRSSAISTIAILLIISTAGVLGWVLTLYQVPEQVAQAFLAISDSPVVFLLLVNLLLLTVGMFLDAGAAIIILAPILVPVAVGYNLDPIHFGIVMVVNLAVGMTTPPVGVNLFVACQIAGLRIDQIMRPMIPLYLAFIVGLLMISFIPELSLWLPRLLR